MLLISFKELVVFLREYEGKKEEEENW